MRPFGKMDRERAEYLINGFLENRITEEEKDELISELLYGLNELELYLINKKILKSFEELWRYMKDGR